MTDQMIRRVKMACYTTNMSMPIVSNFVPILFLTFRDLYGISYSLLGFLVLVNFVTQLGVDLVFSFFSHKINIAKAVKITPALTAVGVILFALSPNIFPNNIYAGFLIGTIIFSSSGGFVEVLLTPVISALPAKDVDREVSKLHSVYAWSVVVVIIITTLYLFAFGSENWQWLALILTLIPIFSFYLYLRSDIPEMETPEKVGSVLHMLKNKTLWMCVMVIFLGGAAECTMAQWSSSYLEQAVGIPKAWGDILGVAVFYVMLGLGRTLYSKYGKSIEKILLAGIIATTACYLTAVISNVPMIGLIACAFTGFCASMLWPGSVIVATERFPIGGVFIYAMMAAGGDLGASVGPQLIGIITDAAIEMPQLINMAESMGMALEQLGMKLGMLVATLFPVAAIPLYIHVYKTRKKG